MMIEDQGKELASLKERVTVIEKTNGSSEGSSIIIADMEYLKKKVASLKSMELSSFWDGLEVPP